MVTEGCAVWQFSWMCGEEEEEEEEGGSGRGGCWALRGEVVLQGLLDAT